MLAKASIDGDALANTLTGTAYGENIRGLGGADVISGMLGDDTITGGAGNDTLWGGNNTTPTSNGSDTYIWSKGDGNDMINDWSQSLTEVDALILSNVMSTDVTLTRTSATGHDTLITIISTGEVITIDERFQNTFWGYGIEKIVFGDGVVWTQDDLLSRTKLIGTTGADTLAGTTGFADNIYGYGGNDNLNGQLGDDLIVGGTGIDVIDGGGGNDRFEWQSGDGTETLSDTGTSLIEIDTLALTNIASNGVTFSKVANNFEITITATGEKITVANRFANATQGTGVEIIEYSDGTTTTVLNSAIAELVTLGTSAANTLTASWAYRDRMYGDLGNDTINSGAGDDILVGGDGIDLLQGGTGSDTYIWMATEDNDTIDDVGTSLTEADRLVLTGINSNDVSLSRIQGSTNLLVKVLSTGEIVTVANRFNATTFDGKGIEEIQFADGVVWGLGAIFDRTRVEGTSLGDALTGGIAQDNIFGLAGSDTISGLGGDDKLYGGIGNDTLYGGSSTATALDGNDSYYWSKGDGNDRITDTSTSLTEMDTLVLVNVLPTEVTLSRINLTGDFSVNITSTGESITITNRYQSTLAGIVGAGIESIVFADGTIWALADIFEKTTGGYGTGDDNYSGSSKRDNIFGGTGNDTIIGLEGDDYLTGGLGNDVLYGGSNQSTAAINPLPNGNDTYIWSKGDGNDTINDWSHSVTEVDTLRLIDVLSSDVSMTRSGSDLLIKVTSTNEIITVNSRYYDTPYGYGIEKIVFSNGVSWALNEILAATRQNGTSIAETLAGSNYADNIYGYAGNDSILGNNGDDKLFGGLGADTLNGGLGADIASYFNATQGVRIDLAVVTAQLGNAGGEEVGDILQSIEGLEGSNFNDFLYGNNASNILNGKDQNDSIDGLGGFDQIFGGNGNDTINGGQGADSIWGEAGSDLLNGDDGNDTIYGDSANDTISGGGGADVIIGGNGDDALTGGTGTDVFLFADGFGSDQINDFGVDDIINLAAITVFENFEDMIAYQASQLGSDVSINDGLGNSILLKNVLLTSLNEGDFVF
jgi:Ca2+-binding RTX toxin-like protein